MSYPPPPPPGPPGPYGPYGAVPGVPSAEDRNWALAAHVGSLVAAWFAFGFIAPLIVLLVQGQRSAFVRRHAVESLNFQISLLIYVIAGFVLGALLTIVTFGLAALVLVPLALLVAVGALVVIIVATVRAGNGEDYRYPLTLRLVR